ncbi:hypothetical protein VTK26DRAFT_3487 [Humicola hyalothermophila]
MTSPAGPSPDPVAVLASLPECARNCMLQATQKAIEANRTISTDICAPQDPFVADIVTSCVRTACRVKEALSMQNITLSACGVKPHVDQTFIPVFAVFVALSCVAVAMRFWNRFYTSGRFGWDDWFLALALAGCIAYAGIGWEAAPRGLGVEMWSLEPYNITHLFVGFYASMLVYAASRLFLRHSIILFYLRIFTIGNPRPIIIATMIINTLLSVGVAASVAFQCQPVSLFWNRWDGEHEGKCLPAIPVFWSGAIASMVMDVWVILLPLPYVARLQLSLKKRLGISFMLAIGVSVIAFSILKFLSVRTIETSTNPTGIFATVSIWSALEIDLGVICACLPGMRLFVSYHLKRWGWMSSKGSSPPPSRRISFGNNLNLSTTKGKRSTPGGSGSGCSQSKIRITTTIQQKASPSESQTYLPLGSSIELGTQPHGVVRVQAHAWA